MTRQRLMLACAVLVLGAGAARPQSPSPSPSGPPPCSAAEHRQLDFWIGEWDVRGVKQPPAAPPSHSRIERVEGGCVIQEQYTTPGGYSGRSLNAYHAERKQWEQFWVDNVGGVHHYSGMFRDGNMYYEAEFTPPGGSAPTKNRMTFFNQGKDQVRQLGEQSTDGGRTWTVTYDLTYRRRSS